MGSASSRGSSAARGVRDAAQLTSISASNAMVRVAQVSRGEKGLNAKKGR